jgi:UDP-3-O-[3-hydroxymyristoyl] glucosamine N-acyltransferase
MTGKIFTLAELAELTGAKLVGNPQHRITSVSDLDSADVEDASFLAKPGYGQATRYEQAMRKSSAGVIFIHPDIPLVESKNFLVIEDPSRAFQQTLEAIHGTHLCVTGFNGIDPTAVLHTTCKIGQNVEIGPLTVIDKDVVIGDGTVIGAGCYVGPETVIGQNCQFYAKVTVRERCKIGNRVILQPGAVIGSCGFGYTTDRQGRHQKLNQIGNVVLEDDVEIGANTTIDRGRFKSTRICRGTKIDNLVQIGHGVRVGPHNFIVSQSGIAGSSSTGRHVVLAGQCGISGHVHLGDEVILSAKTGVDKPLPKGRYGGSPALPMAEYNRMSVYLRNIEKYVKQIKELESRLKSLEELSR